MHIICAAEVEETRQRANLCECIAILGGVPNIAGKAVCTEYIGESSKAEKFIDLFNNYFRHEIRCQC